MSFKTLQKQLILAGFWLIPQLFTAQNTLELRAVSFDKTLHLPANATANAKPSALTTGLTFVKKILDKKKAKDMRYMTASVPYKIPFNFKSGKGLNFSTIVHYSFPTMKQDDSCLPMLYFSFNMTCRFRKK
jgi:hypothetical protein